MVFQTFITETNKATTGPVLVALWQKAMAVAGFDRVLFSLLTEHGMIDRKAGHIVAVNFPKEWLAKYFASGFEPMRQQMFSAHTAFSWERLKEEQNLKGAQADIFAEGQKTEFYHGIGIPLRGPMGAFAGITAAGSKSGTVLHEDALDHVRLFSQQFYKAFLNLEAKKDSPQGVALTEREREVLTWYARGKTNIEIAHTLHITPRVVKFHLEGVFRKLDVNNGRVAVLRAVSMGLIFPEYDIQKNAKNL